MSILDAKEQLHDEHGAVAFQENHVGIMMKLGDIPGTVIEPRYAGYHNILGRPLSGYQDQQVMGTPELYDALNKLQTRLSPRGIHLLLYDGYRPQRAVDDLVHWCSMPEDEKTKAEFYPKIEKSQLISLGYIADKSSHSRGSAVDLSLVLDGTILDMGTMFDFMDPLSAHHAPGITEVQTENRHRLACCMTEAGFVPYEREWWHYRLSQEPYPNTYFDEVIQ